MGFSGGYVSQNCTDPFDEGWYVHYPLAAPLTESECRTFFDEYNLTGWEKIPDTTAGTGIREKYRNRNGTTV